MNLQDKASLIVRPHSGRAGFILAEKPTNGSANMDVVRASGRTRVKADGTFEDLANNVPALNHFFDGGCPMWDPNIQATNGVLNSFSLTGFIETGVTRVGNVITETVANSEHRIVTPFSAGFVTNTLHCFSYIVKKQSGPDRWVRINSSNSSDGEITSRVFNLQNGAVTGTMSNSGSWSLTGLSDGIVDLKNGFWLIYLTGQSSISNQSNIRLSLCNNSSGNSTYTGDTSVSVFAIGFQREVGSFPTSRIRTEGAAVTRVADSYLKTGVSSLIGQNTFTYMIEWDNQNFGLCNLLEVYNNATGVAGTSSVIIQKNTSTTMTVRVFDSLGNYSDQFTVTYATGRNRCAFAYENGVLVVYLNGALVGTVNRNYSFVATRDTYGFDPRGPYRRGVAYFSLNRLTNAELAALTTL